MAQSLCSVAHAQSDCTLSASDSGSELTVDEFGAQVSTRIEDVPSGDTRTVGVKFEVTMGSADFGGTPSPVILPVQLSGSPAQPVDVELDLVAREPGDIAVQITWLDAPDAAALPLRCNSQSVVPFTFGRTFTATAAARTLTFDAVSGDDQEIEVDEESLPLVVQVESSDGSDVSGLEIRFSVDDDTVAELSDDSVLTDADGQAEITVNGLEAGDVMISAELISDEAELPPVLFELSVVEADAGANLSVVAGDGQDLEIDEPSDPLVVEAADDNGEPLDGRVILWSVEPAAAAMLDNSSTFTDEDGEAVNRVRALVAGEFEVIAEISGVDPEDEATSIVKFSFTAEEAAEGLNLSIVSGDGQELALDQPSEPLLVFASDDDGSALEGEQIEWRVEPPGAAVLDAPQRLTDGNGKAMNRVRAQLAGNFTVVAHIAGADPDEQEAATVRFRLSAATAVAGARLTVVAGNNQSLAVNTPSEPLVVAAVDASGQPLPNAAVQWRVLPPGAAQLDTPSTNTDPGGRAQNRARAAQRGTVEVLASLAGSDGQGPGSVRFVLNFDSVPNGSTLRPVSGNDQNLVPGQPSAPLVVELRDGNNQPVAGARLRFTGAPPGAANFDPPEAQTGADGRASTRVAPQLPGDLVVTVTVVGDPRITVTFTIRGGTAFLPGLNTNQQGVATAVDAACPQLAGGAPPPPGSAGTDLLARCSEIVAASATRPADVQNALNQLLPDEAAPQATASLNIRDAQLRNLDVRLDALRSGARRNGLAGLTLTTNSGALPLDLIFRSFQDDQDSEENIQSGELVSPWGAFLTGTIGQVDRDSTTNNPGFDGDTLSLTAGVDYRFNWRFVGGIALGYDDSSVDLIGDSGSIDTRSLTLSLYGSYATAQDFYIDGRLAYGNLDFDLERNIRYSLGATPVDVTALASPGGDSQLLALTVGRNFNQGRWNFGGYLRGEASNIDLDGYAERVDGDGRAGRGLVVRVDPRELESRTATLGFRTSFTASRDWGVLLPYARLEWVHEFETDPQTTIARFVNDPTNTPIVITGDEQDDGYGNVAIGISGVFANGRSAFLQYERRFAQEAIDRQTFTIGGRFEF